MYLKLPILPGLAGERKLIMSEFKAIETQAELDKIIEGRLARQKESIEGQFKDYETLKSSNTKLETEVGTLKATIESSTTDAKANEQTLSDLNAKIASYETANLRTKIALQNGLPFDLADRLQGTDEASFKADAERLAGFVGNKQQTPPPLKGTERPKGEDENAAYKALLAGVENEGE